jgi:hypothetical protein
MADPSIQGDTKRAVLWVVAGVVALIAVIVVTVFIWKLVTPKMNLYRSNTEKQSVIKEQEAKSEAEVFAAQKRVIAAEAEAEARIIEAESIAQSQQIISETLTPEYLRWRFYEVLSTTDGQIIYVPTEAGLPITEAPRMAPTPTVVVQGDE